MRRPASFRLHVAACIAAVGLCGIQFFADDAKPATQPAMAGNVDMAAMMAAWQKYATPGAEHAELAKWVGEWETLMEDLTPGMGNEKSTGTAKCTMIMGGRILQEEVKGTTMGMPFEGLALTGYDNQGKQYWSTWIDSMSTGAMNSTGTMSGNKMQMKGQFSCPMEDKPAASTYTITIDGNDKRVMEMSMTSASGTPLGAMRITYTRKK